MVVPQFTLPGLQLSILRTVNERERLWFSFEKLKYLRQFSASIVSIKKNAYAFDHLYLFCKRSFSAETL